MVRRLFSDNTKIKQKYYRNTSKFMNAGLR